MWSATQKTKLRVVLLAFIAAAAATGVAATTGGTAATATAPTAVAWDGGVTPHDTPWD